jgi:hypothetical protein
MEAKIVRIADKIVGPLGNGDGCDDDESTGAPVGSGGAIGKAAGKSVGKDEGSLDGAFESSRVGAGVAPNSCPYMSMDHPVS